MASIKKITVNGVTYDLGHSSNDFTTAEKQKLAAIAEGAQVNVIEQIKTDAGNVSVSGKTVNITGLQKALNAGQGIVIEEDGTIKTTFDGEVFRFVEELPTPQGGGVVGPESGWKPGQTPTNFDIFKIYVVPTKGGGTTGNIYSEYIWDNQKGKWELIGEFKATVDLTPYLRKSEYATDKQKFESQMSGLATRVGATEQATNSLEKSKVDKVSGKQLSTNDFTTPEKTKLTGVSAGANKTTFSVTGDTLIITTV